MIKTFTFALSLAPVSDRAYPVNSVPLESTPSMSRRGGVLRVPEMLKAPARRVSVPAGWPS